jgi:toxin ParE1/3/4
VAPNDRTRLFRKLRLSGPARRDLQDIGDYTRREWGAAKKRKYLRRIRDRLEELRDMPGIGAPRGDIAAGLRARLVGKHIVFYRESKTTVTIIRVLHQSMDPGLHL